MSTKKPPIEFKRLMDLDDLPKWLGVTPARLEQFINDSPKFYKKLRLTKYQSPPKDRIVYRVDRELAALQRHIARSIALTALGSFTDRDHVQGFVKDHSITKNAKQHCAKKIVLCIDLQDFFGSIHIDTIRKCFEALRCGRAAADALAKICTLNGILPQGASTSPILSNIAARSLDQSMLDIANDIGCTYTRYVDDLTFSGDLVPSEQQLRTIIENHGFVLNAKKTRKQPIGKRQYVTGLTVCDAKQPRIPRRMKKFLRRGLHCATIVGLKSHCARSKTTEKRLKGLICYVNSVEPELGKRMLDQFNKAKSMDEPKLLSSQG